MGDSEITTETPPDIEYAENTTPEEQTSVSGEPSVPDWGDCGQIENEEDPAFDENELLKSRAKHYHQNKTRGQPMDYQAFYQQIEELRGQISDQNRRIVELECSLGRVGVAFSHMSNLHSVFQGKNLTVTGNGRERRYVNSNSFEDTERPYFGNRNNGGGGRNGRSRGGRNFGKDYRT